MDEQIIVDIRVDSDAFVEAEKRVDQLTDSIEELANRISTARKQNSEYKKQQRELNDEYEKGNIKTKEYEKKVDALNVKINTTNKIIAESVIQKQKDSNELKANIKLITSQTGAYEKLSKSLNEARKKAKDLAVQFGANSNEFKTAQSEVLKLDKRIKAIDNSLGQNQRSVGKYGDALKGVGSELMGAFGITAGIGAVVAGFQAFNEKAKVLIKVTNQIEQTFGLARDEARKLSNDVVALADNFDTDYKEVLTAANVVSKEFNISAEESLKLIEEGFQKGSNNSGEFLDILKEYPTQLKSIGLNAQESFAIINQQVKNGTYSDKGIDALKEGGLRLRENTAATKEALKVLSESTQEQIKTEIAAGNTFKAMQLISTELKNSGLTAQETQTIMADVFGGAGEDALSFVMNLDEISLSLDGVANQTSIVEDANLQLDKSWNNFVSSVDNGSGIISTSLAGVKNFFSGVLESLGDLNDGTTSWIETLGRTGLLGSGVKAQVEATIIARKAIKKANKEEISETDLIAEKRKKDAEEFKKQKAESRKLYEKEAALKKSLREKEITNGKESAAKEKERIKKEADEKIRIIEETSARELEILNATNAEKKLLQIGAFVEIAKIREEENNAIFNAIEKNKQGIAEEFEYKKQFADKERELRTQQIEEVRTATQELNMIAAEFAGELSFSFGMLSESIFKAFEDGELNVENTLSLISAATDVVFSAIAEKNAQEFSDLEARKESELELAGDNEEAKLAIEEKFEKESAKLKLKQFNLDKAAALSQIAIQTALAITKSLPNIPLSIVVGGIGLVQAGIVAAKKPPKFGDGTSDIVNIGGSHASGNDTTVVGFSGGKSQVLGKVERGERMPVIKASAANDMLVSQLNSKGRIFANGTNDILSSSNTTNNNGLTAEQVKDIVRNMPPIYTKVEDVIKEISRKAQIVDNGKV